MRLRRYLERVEKIVRFVPPSAEDRRQEADMRRLAASLLARMDEAGDIRLAEDGTRNETIRAAWSRFVESGIAPAQTNGLVRAEKLNLLRPGTWCARADDPKALGGRAVKIFNSSDEWCVFFPCRKVAFKPGERYVLRAHVRVETKPGTTGVAFWTGVYDYAHGVERRHLRQDVAAVKGGDYAWYDVLTWTPTEGDRFWIGSGPYGAGGKPAVEAVWIDAVELVPVEAPPVRKLPGENGDRSPISPAPFPDRLSAYVWRNWGLVEKTRLAEVVGASVRDLTDMAVQMGLAPDPPVVPEWKTKGYITVLRRNWHLLPYEQLLKLVGKTRDELYFSLMEDDFLWIKLGSVKPNCGRLTWQEGEANRHAAARRRLAAILKEEGLDPAAAEEPRFSFIRDIAAVDPAFKMPTTDASPFDFRVIFSYFADYGDPLADPEIGSFPEGLLQKLAAQGVNGVWLHTVLRTLAKDPKYPEFGDGSEKRMANLRSLVARCAKYGIRVFLYLNEPRAMPAEFFDAKAERKAFKGAGDGVQFAMCTSDPEVRRWLRDSIAQVFSQVPGLGGIFTITMSENLTNCASRWHRERCPRCKDRPVGDIVAEVNNAMISGMVKGNPKAEALLYSWAWPQADEPLIVSKLPRRNCRVMAVSEKGMPICRGGVRELESDYSISIVGPGEYAKRLWSLCRTNGIPAMAKVQAGNSWELSAFPYVPTMDLVAQHAVNLANERVSSVMLSWSLGCCPSPNLSVYRDLRKGETTVEGLLDRLAERLYGKDRVPQVRRAWKAFSDGFANYPFSCQTIYDGPHHWGPANPLYAEKTGYRATMVGIPYDDLDGWRKNYPGETYAELMDKVANGFAEGCRLMDGVTTKRELDMFRAEQMHFASCRDQARFVLARNARDVEGMRRLARAELDRAKAYWPLVLADSRIGYESSNHYFFVPRDVLEKVLSCRRILDRVQQTAPASDDLQGTGGE